MDARELVLERFRWVDGHADVWALFRDGDVLRTLGLALVEPFESSGITAVCGVEARGFLIGGIAAAALGVGFVPVRKPGGLLPGPHLVRETGVDWRGHRWSLRLQESALDAGDRVLLVDDWIETGSQASAVAAMVRSRGARMVGCSVIVDDLHGPSPPSLGRLCSIVSSRDLPAA